MALPRRRPPHPLPRPQRRRSKNKGKVVSDLIVGLGIFLLIEGLAYALAPRALKALARRLPEISDDQLRWSGLAVMLLGLALVWIVRG